MEKYLFGVQNDGFFLRLGKLQFQFPETPVFSIFIQWPRFVVCFFFLLPQKGRRKSWALGGRCGLLLSAGPAEGVVGWISPKYREGNRIPNPESLVVAQRTGPLVKFFSFFCWLSHCLFVGGACWV